MNQRDLSFALNSSLRSPFRNYILAVRARQMEKRARAKNEEIEIDGGELLPRRISSFHDPFEILKLVASRVL